MKLELFVALRYLRARRRQGFISLITVLSMAGVGLGVCALIVVLSVMNGFEGQVKQKILGLNSHIMIFKAGEALEDPQTAVARLNKDPEVMAATPFVYGQVMAVSRAGASGAVLRGVQLPGALEVLEIARTITSGDIQALDQPDPEGLPKVFLGTALARNLGVTKGAVINLVNPLGEDTPVGRAPKSEPFRVAGLFQSGMYQYDNSLLYVALPAAQEMMGLGQGVTGVEVRIQDLYQAESVGRRLAQELGPLFYARDWITTNHSLFSALKLERIVMFLILTLIVLVAAFGIVSSLIMLVMEKHKDIAILKAMGATRAMVGRIFIMDGLVIGVCGTLMGLGLGLVLCGLLARYQFIELPPDVYAISKLPVDVQPWLVALVCVSAVAISLLATIYPARAAGRLDPVEALRYE